MLPELFETIKVAEMTALPDDGDILELEDGLFGTVLRKDPTSVHVVTPIGDRTVTLP